MFKVTEVVKSRTGERTNINYVSNGNAATVMLAVCQILNHRLDNIDNLVDIDAIVIRVNGNDNIDGVPTVVNGAYTSDVEIMEAVLHYLKDGWGYPGASAHDLRFVIQF